MKVKVLLNRAEDEVGRLLIFARFGAQPKWDPSDRMEEVISFDTDKTAHDEVLALAWEMFNRGAPKFVGDYMFPHRSLSVGDVVDLDGTRYFADSVGWVKCPEPEVVEFQIRPSMLVGAHPVICTDEEMRSHLDEMYEAAERDPDPDLTREAYEEMMMEGEVIAADESWFGGFSQFIDGHGNGSGRGF